MTVPTNDLTTNTAGGGAARKAAELKDGTPVFLRVLDRAVGIRTEDRSWVEGAKGERRTAKALARLEKRGWFILHDVTVGSRGANIDHVAIGPPGVFVIDTKYTSKKVEVHADTLKFGGYRRTKYVTAMWHQRDLASARLAAAVGFAVPVQPVLCLVTTNPMKIRGKIAGLWICHAEGIVRMLHKADRHPDLTDRQIDAIKQAARESAVWLPSTATPEPDPEPDEEERDDSEVADVAMVRWRKFGHDRVYATGPDGERLGWIDMTTGQAKDVPDGRDDVLDTLEAMRAQLLADADAPPTAEAPAPAPPGPGLTVADGISVTEWKRYGKHRFYANRDGHRLGWIDAITGNVHLEAGSGPDVENALRVAIKGPGRTA